MLYIFQSFLLYDASDRKMFESDKTKKENGIKLAQWNWRNPLSLLSVY